MKLSKQKSTFLVIGIVMLVNALSYGIIIPLLYPYSSRFGLSAPGLGVLFASFSLAQLIATPIIGRLSDKYGRKPLLLLSLFGTAISLAFFASARSIPMLFFARVLDGITGGNNSVAQAMLADTTPAKDRAKAFGALGALFGVGFVIGPAVGGILSQISLSAPFWFASGFALFGTLLGLILLKETNVTKEVKQETQLINFSVILQAFKSKATGPILFISFIVLTSQNAMIIGFQSFTVDILKLSATRIGLIFTLYGFITIITQGFGIKWLLSKFPKKIALLQKLFIASALVMFIVAASINYIWFVVAILAYGVFSSPIPAILTSIISERTKAEDQGGILGINQSLTSLAQIIGPLLSALAVAFNTRFAFILTAALLLVSYTITRYLANRTKLLDL